MKKIKKLYKAAIILLAIMTIFMAVFAEKDASQTKTEALSGDNAQQNRAADQESEDTATGENVGEISTWQLYESEEGKFRLDVPGDWMVKENKDEYGNIVVAFVSPETYEAVKKEQESLGQNYGVTVSDVIVSYSATVAREAENMAHGYGANTLEGLIAKSLLIKKVGETELNGLPAVEVTIGGESDSYGIYIEKEGRLYKIIFLKRADKASLNGIEKKILETFKIE